MTSKDSGLENYRAQLYAAVRNADPTVYRRVVEIAHLADPVFIRQVDKRCAEVESAVMMLVAELLGVKP